MLGNCLSLSHQGKRWDKNWWSKDIFFSPFPFPTCQQKAREENNRSHLAASPLSEVQNLVPAHSALIQIESSWKAWSIKCHPAQQGDPSAPSDTAGGCSLIPGISCCCMWPSYTNGGKKPLSISGMALQQNDNLTSLEAGKESRIICF